MHRDAAARHQDVAAGELAGLAQRHGRAFVDHIARRQLAAADAGVGEQGAGAAFDVDPAVGAGGAAVAGNLVELFLALGEVQRQGFQALGALLEVHGHQFLEALLTGVGDGFGEVQRLLVGARHGLAIERAT